MSTAQKVAIVTGASQGIGAALVRAFRSRDYKVVANSRSIKAIADPDVVPVQGDVADPVTADLVFEEALKRFGHVDTLVNNAGIFIAKPFTAYSMDDYAVYMATNVTGLLSHDPTRCSSNEQARARSHRDDHDKPGRSADDQRTGGACISHQGSVERGDEVARHRVRKKWRARECRFTGHHQDADASGRGSSGFGVDASDGSNGGNVRRR